MVVGRIRQVVVLYSLNTTKFTWADLWAVVMERWSFYRGALSDKFDCRKNFTLKQFCTYNENHHKNLKLCNIKIEIYNKNKKTYNKLLPPKICNWFSANKYLSKLFNQDIKTMSLEVSLPFVLLICISMFQII